MTFEKELKFSIVIPCKELNPYVKKCLEHCLELDYENFEIMLLSDERVDLTNFQDKRIKSISTGPVKPSVKKNMSIEVSQADILAFIDSDSYPVKDWLSEAVKYFNNLEVGAVGGPNLTPPDSSGGQRVSGYILSSPISAGQFALRYKLRKQFRKGLPVKEMPSCNLIVRKELAQKIGGFDQNLLTGEDSKFCFDIRKSGKKVIYAPDTIVYHYRRDLWKPHLKQMWIYGRDKARVIKEDFSFDKLYYFIPLLFVLFLISGAIASLFLPFTRTIFLFLIGIYLCLNLMNSIITDWKLYHLILLGTILTHICYGLGSFYGLIYREKSKDL